MPLIVHHTCYTLHSLLYSNIVCYLYKVKEGIFIWTFGTNVPGGVGNAVKTKVGRTANQSHNLGPFRQAGINLSNVSRGRTCQNFKQNGYLHASP